MWVVYIKPPTPYCGDFKCIHQLVCPIQIEEVCTCIGVVVYKQAALATIPAFHLVCMLDRTPHTVTTVTESIYFELSSSNLLTNLAYMYMGHILGTLLLLLLHYA